MTAGAQQTLPFPERKVLSVRELTRRIKNLVEPPLKFVHVEGEISNHKVQQAGHHYFTLKDEEASLGCIVWQSSARLLRFEPADGMNVIAWGRVEIYAPYGKYQLIVDGMEPRGLGALQMRFEQLRDKLQRDGLFDPARKRPLPFLPRRVALVTSPTGAALQDMLRTIFTRFPRAHVLLYPVRVQGDGAAEEIAHALRHINLARPDIDVIIAGRGGGSIEDLWAFNEEVVARAIADSRIPVVSAVGHETDTTIADFVADVRALTPTDAGQRVLPRLADLEDAIDELRAKLRRALRTRAETERARLGRLGDHHALRSPERIARDQRQRLDGFIERLAGALRGVPERRRQNLDRLRAKVQGGLPPMRAIRRELDARAQHLAALDPRAILKRGYSITYDGRGRIVSDAKAVSEGDEIRTVLGNGAVRSTVNKKEL